MMQYPDTATFVEYSGGGIDSITGWPLSKNEKVVKVRGRYENKTKDVLIQVTNAKSVVPTFIFYMPLGQSNIPIGVTLSVFDKSSGMEYSGKVVSFNKGLMNSYAVCSNL